MKVVTGSEQRLRDAPKHPTTHRTDPPSQFCNRFIGPQMPKASRMWNSEVFIFREGSITQLVIH